MIGSFGYDWVLAFLCWRRVFLFGVFASGRLGHESVWRADLRFEWFTPGSPHHRLHIRPYRSHFIYFRTLVIIFGPPTLVHVVIAIYVSHLIECIPKTGMLILTWASGRVFRQAVGVVADVV